GGFLWMTWSSLSDQAQYAGQHLTDFERQTIDKLPSWSRASAGAKSGGEIQSRIAPYALRVARSAASAVIVAALGFILTVYFLIEGRRTRDWLVAFVPVAKREKVGETYLVSPYVYGDRLKLSNLAVILAFAVGAEIAGVIGALIALPLAAAYPAVERIWLKDKLAEDTVRAHRAIEHRKAG